MPQILAITLDLDDTLWPMRPVLINAERALSEWLRLYAPRTADLLGTDARAKVRARVIADNPARAHDVSFLRRESLRIALQMAGEDPAHAEPAFQVFFDARQRVTPFADVLPVLTRWAARYRLVAISNGNADLARIGLAAHFSERLAAHDFEFAKPDPRIFHEACRRIGVAPQQVLHVGDDLQLDVFAARNAGLQAAWIRRPQLVESAVCQTQSGAAVEKSDLAQPDKQEPEFADLDALDAHLQSVGADP
jgi:2-haloalkanoic acid dehalogenase type II